MVRIISEVGKTYKQVFLKISLIFALIFFFIIEWRWEFMLIGFPDIKPYTLAAVISIGTISIGMFNIGKKDSIFWLFLLLIIYFICVSIINIRVFCGDNQLFIAEFGVWSIDLALFIVANNKDFWQFIYRHPHQFLVMYALFLLPFVLIMIYLGAITQANFNLRNLVACSGINLNSAYGVSYQSFGDKLAIITFIIFSLNVWKGIKVIIGSITLVALYAVGSKASLFGYFFACVVYYIIFLFRNRYYIQCIIVIVSIISLICSVAIYIHIVDLEKFKGSNNWIVRTVAHGRGDRSILSRRLIEEENQKTRASRWILGDYKFDDKLGRHGSYTHNALGLIDYYGVPIFAIAVCLWFYILLQLIHLIGNNNRIASAALMSILFYTLLFSVARFPSKNYLTFWTLGMSILATTWRRNDISLK